MQTITGYLYPNWIQCHLNADPNLLGRNTVMYAAPIKMYKGIDNTLKFVFKNQDQKRIFIDEYTLTMYVFGTNTFTANTVATDTVTVTKLGDDGVTVQPIEEGEAIIEDSVEGAGTGPILTFVLEIIDDGSSSETRGVASLSIPKEDLALLESDSYYYSISADNAIEDFPVYVDDNFGARGTIQLISGVYPQ